MTECPTPTTSSEIWRDAWINLPEPLRVPFLTYEMTAAERERLYCAWNVLAHLHQREPAAAQGGGPWNTPASAPIRRPRASG
jgi:hypothetical protein